MTTELEKLRKHSRNQRAALRRYNKIHAGVQEYRNSQYWRARFLSSQTALERVKRMENLLCFMAGAAVAILTVIVL